jgi:hypothetical protein
MPWPWTRYTLAGEQAQGVTVDIESLRYVVSLADELHFGRAARRHYVSAGYFGRRVQRLERELGQRLFDRTSRRVELTPAGARVVAHAHVVLGALDGLRASADPLPFGEAGVLRVGVLGFGMAERWPRLRDMLTGASGCAVRGPGRRPGGGRDRHPARRHAPPGPGGSARGRHTRS